MNLEPYPEWLIEHCEKVLIMMNFRPCKAIRTLAIQNLNEITSKVIAFGGVITWHKEKLIPARSEKEWMKEAFDSLWNKYVEIRDGKREEEGE